MVLYPLEFAECYLDSPFFRSNIQEYEEELERTDSQIKKLIKDARNMLAAFVQHEKMVEIFSQSLQSFRFDCIGEKFTDVEKGIAGSLCEFGIMLKEVADEWSQTIKRLDLQLVSHLEEFRSINIDAYREARKNFEKSSERYYKQLDHTLALSHKKKEQQLSEADNEVSSLKRSFHGDALKYVDKLQEVEEKKKFEFVEHLLMFMQVYFNYFHQTHEYASDCKFYMSKLQGHLVSTRGQYDETREKSQNLMKKMTEHPDPDENVQSTMVDTHWSRAGHLMLLEKSPKNSLSSRFSSKWIKCFCMYKKEEKVFRIVVSPHFSSNTSSFATGSKTSLSIHSNNSNSCDFSEELIVKTCTRRITDSVDRRFCFDLEVEDKNGKQQTITLQATSDGDRHKWMRVMDGKEPEYVLTKVMTNKEDLCKLNDLGLQFVTNLIQEIERRGLRHEGIYRLVGIMSKVDLLLRKALTSKTSESIDYTNEMEWETNVLTSALKAYFRNLPEPIMTFDLHSQFIDAAKCEKHEDRIKRVFELVAQLPEMNRKMLTLLSEHLEKVQKHQEINKMSVANLGVCFGPTLMRQKQETVQAILEIKFSNIISEILIEERRFLFEGGSTTEMEVKPQNDSASSKASLFYRLPSQRIKVKVNEPLYTLTSFANILDNDGAKKLSPERSRFNRHKAVREHRNSTSSRSNFSRGSPTSGDDAVSHVIYDEVMDEDASTQSSQPNDHQDLSSDSKSPSTCHHSPKIKSSSSSSINNKKFLPEGDNHPNPPRENSAKVRVSPKPRRSRVQQDKKSTTTEFENSNNSNTKPAVPIKPKAITDSFKQRKARFVTTVKGGLSTHSAISKKKQKVLRQGDVRGNPVFRNKSMIPGGKQVTGVYSRPLSEFIPAAFRADEPDLHPDAEKSLLNGKADGEIRKKSSSFRSQTSDTSSGEHSSTSGEATDDELTSTVARTLYACYGDQSSELSFEPGQIIRGIQRSNEPGWLIGNLNGKVGLVPRNYLAFI